MTGVIVHEWVAPRGGSESVVQEMLAAFPSASLHVLWDDAPGRFASPTKETWIARTALRRSKVAALPAMPLAWRHLRLASDVEPEWMLVSSHLFAHHARFSQAPRLPKLVYAHTPARYVWQPDIDKRGASVPVRLASMALRPLDRHRAREARAVAANSEFTRERIERCWGREAEVIYPPVDVERITAVGDWTEYLRDTDREGVADLPDTFLLGASRFVAYKELEKVIDAGEACDLPVVLAGSGPAESELRARADTARVPVHFVLQPSDELLFTLYSRAHAFIFPAVEDFGIMPVEAMAAGAPVVVPARGGAAESVRLASGGSVVEDQSPAGWREAVSEASSIDRTDMAGRLQRFSSAEFRSQISAWVDRSTK